MHLLSLITLHFISFFCFNKSSCQNFHTKIINFKGSFNPHRCLYLRAMTLHWESITWVPPTLNNSFILPLYQPCVTLSHWGNLRLLEAPHLEIRVDKKLSIHFRRVSLPNLALFLSQSVKITLLIKRCRFDIPRGVPKYYIKNFKFSKMNANDYQNFASFCGEI